MIIKQDSLACLQNQEKNITSPFSKLRVKLSKSFIKIMRLAIMVMEESQKVRKYKIMVDPKALLFYFGVKPRTQKRR